MRKYIFMLYLVLPMLVLSQTTKTYLMTHSVDGMGNIVGAPGISTPLTIKFSSGSLQAKGVKYTHQGYQNGGDCYVNYNWSGNSYEPQAIMVSSDKRHVIEVLDISMGMWTNLYMYNHYDFYADGAYTTEDIYRQSAELNNFLYGGSSGSGSTNSGRSSTGKCTSCGGSGVDPSPDYGMDGSATWVKYYNSKGTKCPYCGSYREHRHNRCSSCNVPRY